MRALVAGALLLAGLLLFQPGLALPVHTVPLKAHRPVLIDGDADWCDRVNAQGLDDDGVDCLAGDGSVGEPYVIQGWKFNLAAFPPGTAAITIQNTTKNWLIQNNVFYDTRQERVRDGIVLLGASDDRGIVAHNRFEDLRVAVEAREWMATVPCTASESPSQSCFVRRISAPDVDSNQFRRNHVALRNGPNLGYAFNHATGAVGLNNFDQSFQWAYIEVLPTKWQPALASNWWGNPLGPTLEPQSGLGPVDPGGRVRAHCANSQALPTGQPRCMAPWLPAPDPLAGPVALWD